MRRTACAWMLLLMALGGCMSMERSSGGGRGGPPTCAGNYGPSRGPTTVPGMQGAWGTPVSMIQPYASAPPGDQLARLMMQQSVPLNMVQMHGPSPGMTPAGYSPGQDSSGLVQAQYNPAAPGGAAPVPVGPPGGMLSPPGVPFAPGLPSGGPMMPFGAGVPGFAGTPGASAVPGAPGAVALPANPGAYGVAGGYAASAVPFGYGSGGYPPAGIPYNARIPGAVAAVGATPGSHQLRFGTQRTQVRFVQPTGMKVSWYVSGADGKGGYSQTAIETPGRYNFLQASVYRLKLSNIVGLPGLEIYPTLEVVPSNPATEAFLAHSAVPLSFTPEDFRQIAAGNYVVKVIYLPDPRYQDLAFVGPGEISSTQLEPGVDPIEEARRRGHILLVIRMGNMDEEAPNTPAINAPGPFSPPPQQLVPQPSMLPPGTQVPYLQPQPGQMPALGLLPPVVPPPNVNAGDNKDGKEASPPAPPGVPTSRLPRPGGMQLTAAQQMAVQQMAYQQALAASRPSGYAPVPPSLPPAVPVPPSFLGSRTSGSAASSGAACKT